MQTLDVVGRLIPHILSGEKTSTIRWRERRVAPGPLRLLCDGDEDRTVTVMVTNCTDLPLSKAAAFVGKQDEWPDEVMLVGMREHYPEIELSSTVQVIEFALQDMR